jgi:hypothetical protein
MNKQYEYKQANNLKEFNELGLEGFRFVGIHTNGSAFFERETKKMKDYSTASLYKDLEVPTDKPPF